VTRHKIGHSTLTPAFVEVAVDAPTSPGSTFSYAIPKNLKLLPGHLVRVPFGARNLLGLVLSVGNPPQIPETRYVESYVYPDPIVTERQVELIKWTSNYYRCPLFDAVALTLPPGIRVRPKITISINPNHRLADQSLSPLQEKILSYVSNHGTTNLQKLVRNFGNGARQSTIKLIDKEILLERTQSTHPRVKPKLIKYLALPDIILSSEYPPEQYVSANAPRQLSLLTELFSAKEPILKSNATTTFGQSAVNSLLNKGLVEIKPIKSDRDPLENIKIPHPKDVNLTPEQNNISNIIGDSIKNPASKQKSFLLHGVTGSGKTEIYLNATAVCSLSGKKTIVMAPEIAITHQIVERFAAKFPGQVAVLHSALSPGQRFDQWWKVQQGIYNVVVGSRSAIYSPLSDIGLIIIDEEHEWTYKQQDTAPRYHAREVALKLAELTNATVLMGSASPDITTYHRALTKQHRLLVLPNRVSDRQYETRVSHQNNSQPNPVEVPLAKVNVVDMRQELKDGNSHIFSRLLHTEIKTRIESGEQMILFINRRGSSSFVQCGKCGDVMKCKRCEISLTYHNETMVYICHYCGYKKVAQSRCQSCSSHKLRYRGIGTESIVDSFNNEYPNVSILRWDRDAEQNPRNYHALLERFRSGQDQVLVGTQMIAKGLHFPSVTLVGVVSADVGLQIPDYRAGERTFQILCQIAGRAGRGINPGKVIFQTYQPENYAIYSASRQDFQGFYNEEINFRQDHYNPPFSKLIRLLCTGRNRPRCEKTAFDLGNEIRNYMINSGITNVEALGPTPAYPFRIRGQYRWHIILRGFNPRSVVDNVNIPNGCTVDIDPINLT